MAKTPGLDREGIRLREVPLDVGLANAFADARRRIAYERLLLDVVRGNQTLFMRRDELEAAWKWVDPIREAWDRSSEPPPGLYRRHLGSVRRHRIDRTRRPHMV